MTPSALINTPIGKLAIFTENNQLIKIEFSRNNRKLVSANDAYTKNIIKQIKAYFSKQTKSFDANIQKQGTDFQQRVWRALTKIPYGKTLTYGELAKKLKTSPRAIGNACRKNPTPVIVPCHRIVSQAGLGGFSGKTKGAMLDIKRWLLHHENIKAKS